MSVNPLANLKPLRDDMKLKGWVIDSFLFQYKKQKYIVLVKLYVEPEKAPKYYSVKIQFLEEHNHSASLEMPANVNGLDIKAQTLREYFGIDYSCNLGNILKEFCVLLGGYIPTSVNNNKGYPEKLAMVNALSKLDSQDPSRKYCIGVKRNGRKSDGTLERRSDYNDNVTRIRKPELYEKLSSDTNLSFCYSANPMDEKKDEVIISNWVRNK